MEDQLEILIMDGKTLAGENALSRHSFDYAIPDYPPSGTTALEILENLRGLPVDTPTDIDGHVVGAEGPSEARQRAFLCDVLKSVTDGKLLLCGSRQDLPDRLPAFAAPIDLTDPGSIRRLRRTVEDAMRGIGLPETRIMDFDLAVGEAAMNAFVHTGSGMATVCASQDSGLVHVWIEDKGAGISLEHLPRATLEKGFTTAGTFGHGFKIMLKTVDRLWLLTGNTGTTVVLEQKREETVSQRLKPDYEEKG